MYCRSTTSYPGSLLGQKHLLVLRPCSKRAMLILNSNISSPGSARAFWRLDKPTLLAFQSHSLWFTRGSRTSVRRGLTSKKETGLTRKKAGRVPAAPDPLRTPLHCASRGCSGVRVRGSEAELQKILRLGMSIWRRWLRCGRLDARYGVHDSCYLSSRF